MPDEASTPPADTQEPPPQSGDTAAGQASEPEQFSSENLTDKPVSAPVTEPPQSADAAGQATPPPDLPTEAASAQAGAADPAPEPEQVSENLTGKPESLSPRTNPEDLNGQESETETGKPNAPTTPSVGTDTPPQPLPLEDSQSTTIPVLPLAPTPSARGLATPPLAEGVGGEGGEETPAPPKSEDATKH